MFSYSRLLSFNNAINVGKLAQGALNGVMAIIVVVTKRDEIVIGNNRVMSGGFLSVLVLRFPDQLDKVGSLAGGFIGRRQRSIGVRIRPLRNGVAISTLGLCAGCLGFSSVAFAVFVGRIGAIYLHICFFVIGQVVRVVEAVRAVCDAQSALGTANIAVRQKSSLMRGGLLETTPSVAVRVVSTVCTR
jgi:hypothetical protein